jgi:DNA-binding IclR family transcriptional regulator
MTHDGGRRIRAVAIACDLLDALDERGRAGVTELATALGHSKSTVYSHLQTLDDAGRVTREGTAYRLSYRQLGVAERLRERAPGFDAARTGLEELTAATGEVSAFSVEEDGRVVHLLRITDGPGGELPPRQAEAWPVNLYETGEQEVDVLPPVGSEVPMHCTAAGKALLARMRPARVDAVLDRHGLDRRTHNTITDRTTLREELDATDSRGYALDHEEHVPGIRSVAVAAVTDAEPVGAVSLVGPINRLQDGRISNELHEALVDCADRIAAAAG